MILLTLLSHYRRHPVQGLFLMTGVVIANVLLAGTLLINAQARASYNQGERLLQSGPVARIQSRVTRQGLDERDYIRLRKAGFDNLAPVLRRTIVTDQGVPLDVLGIDLFAMSSERNSFRRADTSFNSSGGFQAFSFSPGQLWLAPSRLRQLGWREGESYRTDSGEQLPPTVAVDDEQLGHRVLMDIGLLQTVSNSQGQISWIAVFSSSDDRLQALQQMLPDQLQLVTAADAPDPAEMTRSFHLNLAAMGLLAFVVGIFLTYNALAFSYTDRRDLIRRMRLAGVERASLRGGLVAELALFLIIGSLVGCWLGAQLAAWLLPGVGLTLAQLYGVYIAYPDSLAPTGFLLPVAMTCSAAVLCVLGPLHAALHTPLLERWQLHWQQSALVRRDRLLLLTGLGFLALSALIALLRPALWPTLAGMASLLLGTALLLPLVLRSILSWAQRLTPPTSPRLSWLVADSRWLLGPAALALMAMTLALVANSGLNTMISSFRQATDQWLDQRLAADLFMQVSKDADEVSSLLAGTFPSLDVGERFRTRLDVAAPQQRSARVEVVSLQESKRYEGSIELLDQVSDAHRMFKAGQGIYISERAFRLDGWQPGDRVSLCDTHASIPVLGVYHDYGNPVSQWLLSQGVFLDCWPSAEPVSLSISGPEDTNWDEVRDLLSEQLGVGRESIINQADLKALGMGVFDRTFTVTRALNALTLLVAAIGIFCAISAIHHHRVGQQALLASLGVSRLERGAMLLLQWGLLGCLCLLLVWPFGVLLAGYLAGVVTPTAFGWSFPLRPDPMHYLQLACWALGSLLLAILLPSLRLLRASPAVLLKEQSL